MHWWSSFSLLFQYAGLLLVGHFVGSFLVEEFGRGIHPKLGCHSHFEMLQLSIRRTKYRYWIVCDDDERDSASPHYAQFLIDVLMIYFDDRGGWYEKKDLDTYRLQLVVHHILSLFLQLFLYGLWIGSHRGMNWIWTNLEGLMNYVSTTTSA